MKKFIAVIIFLFLSEAFAAEVSWMYVQNRRYENGRNLNRLGFGLIDENGCILTDDSRISAVKLFAPNGTPVRLSPFRFDLDEEIFGVYDAMKSQWRYSDTWQRDIWFRADFFEPLIPGTYRLEVTTTDGRLAKSSLDLSNSSIFRLLLQAHLNSTRIHSEILFGDGISPTTLVT